jgi:hypothetical protein
MARCKQQQSAGYVAQSEYAIASQRVFGTFSFPKARFTRVISKESAAFTLSRQITEKRFKQKQKIQLNNLSPIRITGINDFELPNGAAAHEQHGRSRNIFGAPWST